MKQITTILFLLMGLQVSASNLKVRMSSPTIMNDGKTAAYLTIYQTNIIDEASAEYELYAQYQFRINVPSGITFAQKEVEGVLVDDITPNAARFRGTGSYISLSSDQIDGRLSIITSNSSKDKTYYQTDAEGNVIEELLTIGLIANTSVETGSYEISLSEVKFIHLDSSADSPTETVTAALSVVPEGSIRTVLDENSTTAPAAATDVNIQVYRTLAANIWNTICLPFDMSEAQVKAAFGNDVELGDFTGVDTDFDAAENVVGLTANFDGVTAIEANHPYIIKVSSPITEFTVDGVDIAPEDEPSVDKNEKKVKIGKITYTFYNRFVGTYIAETAVPNLSLFLSGNNFYYSTGSTKMKAFRAYFDFYDVLTDVENTYSVKMRFNMDGDDTRIEELTPSTLQAKEEIYDLTGRRVEKTTKGIYIINNKKVLVK